MRNKISNRQILIMGIISGGIIFGIFLFKCLLASDITLLDEMSYSAIALRFLKGDAMLVDDWTPMQMDGFLLMPFVGAYKLIVGSTEGMILYFRILYLLMKLGISIYTLKRLWRFTEDRLYTLIGVCFYYFSTPFNIDTLSYNTIALSMIYLIMVILITHQTRNSDYFLCGIFLAVAVLAHPFILIAYICGIVTLLLHILVQKSMQRKIAYGLIKNALQITGGGY